MCHLDCSIVTFSPLAPHTCHHSLLSLKLRSCHLSLTIIPVMLVFFKAGNYFSIAKCLSQVKTLETKHNHVAFLTSAHSQ